MGRTWSVGLHALRDRHDVEAVQRLASRVWPQVGILVSSAGPLLATRLPTTLWWPAIGTALSSVGRVGAATTSANSMPKSIAAEPM
jgi:hypothetical protein